jgi:hypothetical protein
MPVWMRSVLTVVEGFVFGWRQVAAVLVQAAVVEPVDPLEGGDFDPGDVTLTVRLDPLPTERATTAIAQLCEQLTATQTRYPGTNLILRYEVKTRP